eukprot:364615-Chlamydomonas_euryale.AAC.52
MGALRWRRRRRQRWLLRLRPQPAVLSPQPLRPRRPALPRAPHEADCTRITAWLGGGGLGDLGG